MMAQAATKKRVNLVSSKGVVIRYLSDRMYKLIMKRQPVKIQVGGMTVEIRSRNEKQLKKIAALQEEIKRLKKDCK
jgi:hypothetical protein